ncbi:MAG: membrane lipoprotein lipid attachment site-containing protein [Spirosomataceae bacterium]
MKKQILTIGITLLLSGCHNNENLVPQSNVDSIKLSNLRITQTKPYTYWFAGGATYLEYNTNGSNGGSSTRTWHHFTNWPEFYGNLKSIENSGVPAGDFDVSEYNYITDYEFNIWGSNGYYTLSRRWSSGGWVNVMSGSAMQCLDQLNLIYYNGDDYLKSKVATFKIATNGVM